MGLPTFISQIGGETQLAIEDALTDLEAHHNVRILFAVESGSRAWGFPSPDSDYDVRFVYAHTVDWYLSISPGRDVIELPITDDLDINGWDIRKALGLLVKPNPVMLEWLSSPIRYVWDDMICEKLIQFARSTTHRAACLHHYLKIGETQWARYVEGQTEVNLKKYFYVLRPALAIRWIRLHPEIAPPMNLQELTAGADIDADSLHEMERLLALKGQSNEMGLGPRVERFDRLAASEFEWARQTDKHNTSSDLVAEADMLFRTILKAKGEG